MYRIRLIVLLLCLSAVSCVKYDALPFEGSTLPRKCGYTSGVTNDWIYFNLSTGEIYNRHHPNEDIQEGEQYNRTDWDFAFCGCLLRTNSGSSGTGKGGAADLGPVSYERWTAIDIDDVSPDLEWVIDTPDNDVTMSQNDWNHYLMEHGLDFDSHPWFDPNSGPPKTKTDANPLLCEALTFAGPPPVYTPSNHAYVIRTADGKRYFKIWVISWFNANVEIGDEGGRISYYLEELTPTVQ